MLKLTDIYKKYKTSNFELKKFSLEIPDNSLNFILGKSGSGKTTLLNILSGLDKTFEGNIEIENEIWNAKSTNLDSYRREKVGYIFQDFKLITSLNVEDNILSEAKLCGNEVSKEELNSICSYLKISKLLKRPVNKLSGGEKQRVAIARCLAKKSKILLCDEPTGSLDSKNAEAVFSILKEISKEKIVIVVSHNEKAAEKYADNIIRISDGIIDSSGVILANNSECNTEDKKPSTLKRPKGGFLMKMGLNAFKTAPIRTVFQTLLSVVAISSFSFITNYRYLDQNLPFESCYKNNINAFSLERRDTLAVNDEIEVFQQYLTNVEVNEICSTFNIDYYTVSYFEFENFASNNFAHSYKMEICDVSGSMEIDEEFLNKYSYSLACGNLPTNENEVVIPSYIAYCFTECGYKSGEKVEINSYSELLGKTVQLYGKNKGTMTFNITGIIDIPFQYQNGSLFDIELIHETLNTQLFFAPSTSLFSLSEIQSIFVPLSGDVKSDKSLFKLIEKEHFNFAETSLSEEYYCQTKIEVGSGCFQYFKNAEYRYKEMSSIFIGGEILFALLYVGSALCFFAYFLSKKNKETETLKSLGFGKKEILSIYSISAILNALIISLASIIVGIFANQGFYQLSFSIFGLPFALRSFTLIGLLAIILLPIICNLGFTTIFARTNISKKYE